MQAEYAATSRLGGRGPTEGISGPAFRTSDRGSYPRPTQVGIVLVTCGPIQNRAVSQQEPNGLQLRGMACPAPRGQNVSSQFFRGTATPPFRARPGTDGTFAVPSTRTQGDVPSVPARPPARPPALSHVLPTWQKALNLHRMKQFQVWRGTPLYGGPAAFAREIPVPATGQASAADRPQPPYCADRRRRGEILKPAPIGRFIEFLLRADFSKAERGKFYRKGAHVRLPIYLDGQLKKRLGRIAQKKAAISATLSAIS